MDDKAYDEEMGRITAKAAEDPPTSNVFLYKHEARSMLTDLRTKLTDLCKANRDDTALLLKLVKTNITIASNLFEVESMPEGYEYLERAEMMVQALRNKTPYDWEKGYTKAQLEKLLTKLSGESDDTIDHEYTPVILEIFNLAGYHWCGCGKTEKAISILTHSEAIYHDFDQWAQRKGDDGVQHLKVSDVGEETTGSDMGVLRARVEQSFTSTLFYLAQVYGNDGKAEEGSKYCHLTLHRQLASKKEFDRVEWSVNALGLCSFYLSNNNYGAAFHCIEASDKVLDTYIAENTHLDDKGVRVANHGDVDEEKVGQTEANIAQAYGKWYYYLVKYYRDLHTGMPEDEEPKPPETLPIEWWVSFACGVPEPKQPEPIGKGLAAWPTVLDYWKKAKAKYEKAMKWYDFDGFVTDHIQIQQDLSSFLKLLLHWDVAHEKSDPFGLQIDRQVAIHKQRAKMLEDIPGNVSEKHYLNFCRQCWYELGEIYNEVADLRITQRQNRKKMKAGEQALSKKAINKSVKLARKYFDKWIDTFKDDDGNAPEALDPDVCQAYVSARTHSIRLGTKTFAASAKDEYRQMELAVVEYNELVRWAEAHPQYREKLCKDDAIRLQIELAKEMTRLLPSKMRDVEMAFRTRG